MAKKIPVGVLGARGMVGQKLIELLAGHSLFEIVAVAGSEQSAGKTYGESVNWLMKTPLPREIGGMKIAACEPNLPCRAVFSALDSSVAGEVEEKFRNARYGVISNAKNHRLDPDVPLVIPEVNSEQLELIKTQKHDGGFIVANPNCSTIGLVLALKPLLDGFGLLAAHVTTLQAISGAGHPGVASLDILGNVIPFIEGEEEKMETEPKKILGVDFKISAQCNRVGVDDGHTECVSVKLAQKATAEEIKSAWENYLGNLDAQFLPSSPAQIIRYFPEKNCPQPKLHRDVGGGMAIAIGRLRPCPVFDWKFVLLTHNTVRGAAGGTILVAELLLKNGYFDKLKGS